MFSKSYKSGYSEVEVDTYLMKNNAVFQGEITNKSRMLVYMTDELYISAEEKITSISRNKWRRIEI